MKKIAITFLCCLITIFAQAQTEHLKFMGIPLNGTINQFQTKLIAKGIKHDVQGSKTAEIGTRLFIGTFASEKCDIYVRYSNKSKIVYNATVVIDRYGEDAILSLYDKFKGMLKSKYTNIEEEEGTSGGYPSYDIDIFNDNHNQAIGYISLFIYKYENSYNEYGLFIDYNDYANEKSNKQHKMDDL